VTAVALRPRPAGESLRLELQGVVAFHDAGRRLRGGPTLDDLICGAWEGLAAHRPVACPVCGGEMASGYGTGPGSAGGGCRRCDSHLS
jgi:hypothetical protein